MPPKAKNPVPRHLVDIVKSENYQLAKRIAEHCAVYGVRELGDALQVAKTILDERQPDTAVLLNPCNQGFVSKLPV